MRVRWIERDSKGRDRGFTILGAIEKFSGCVDLVAKVNRIKTRRSLGFNYPHPLLFNYSENLNFQQYKPLYIVVRTNKNTINSSKNIF